MIVRNFEIILTDYQTFNDTLHSKIDELEKNGNYIVDISIDTILKGRTNKYQMGKVVNETTYYAKIIYVEKEWHYEG